MTMGYLRSRGWTRGEIAIWLSALLFAIVGGFLALTDVLGHWVILVTGLIGIAVSLMRYRAEARQKRGAGDVHDVEREERSGSSVVR